MGDMRPTMLGFGIDNALTLPSGYQYYKKEEEIKWEKFLNG